MAEPPEMTATANRSGDSDRSTEHVIREAITADYGEWSINIAGACGCGDCANVIADAVLATRIPQACQTCKGTGLREVHHTPYDDCPDCPTNRHAAAVGVECGDGQADDWMGGAGLHQQHAGHGDGPR